GDGALWFTEYYPVGKIGRITTGGVITEYPLPDSEVGPFEITTGPDGALWFTEAEGSSIGRLALGNGAPVPSVLFGFAGGTSNPTVFVAEPVNSATGDYFSSHVDLAVRARGLSFSFTRNYNSLDSSTGPLGNGWTHTYHVLLDRKTK